MPPKKSIQGDVLFWSKLYLGFCRDCFKTGSIRAGIFMYFSWLRLAAMRARKETEEKSEELSPFTYTMH
ncbi:hypothetical protein SCOR_18865 [Sulfidibacter corallicola]